MENDPNEELAREMENQQREHERDRQAEMDSTPDDTYLLDQSGVW